MLPICSGFRVATDSVVLYYFYGVCHVFIPNIVFDTLLEPLHMRTS